MYLIISCINNKKSSSPKQCLKVIKFSLTADFWFSVIFWPLVMSLSNHFRITIVRDGVLQYKHSEIQIFTLCFAVLKILHILFPIPKLLCELWRHLCSCCWVIKSLPSLLISHIVHGYDMELRAYLMQIKYISESEKYSQNLNNKRLRINNFLSACEKSLPFNEPASNLAGNLHYSYSCVPATASLPVTCWHSHKIELNWARFNVPPNTLQIISNIHNKLPTRKFNS